MYQYDWSSIPGALPYLCQGMVRTLQITGVAIAVGVVLGTLIAVARLSKSTILSNLAALYVNGFRSIPLVMVLLWFYLLVPQLITSLIGHPGFDIRLLGFCGVCPFRGLVLRRDHSGRNSKCFQRASFGKFSARYDGRTNDASYCPATGLPAHDSASSHPSDHSVPGHVSRLRYRLGRIFRRRLQYR